MTSLDYGAALAEACGWQADDPIPYWMTREGLRRLEVRVGIYFACIANGQLDYVGSARRPSSPRGVAIRALSHSAGRRNRWARFWVLPLRVDCPIGVVRAIEGQIIDLLNPPENRRAHAPRLVRPPGWRAA